MQARVVRNYVPKNSQDLFGHSPYQADKRLRDIGISNHSAAILAVLDTSNDRLGHLPIEQAIVRQRNATPTKMLAGMIQTNQHNEECRGQDEDELLYKVNLTHIATKIPVRWTKVFKVPEDPELAPVAGTSGDNSTSKR